MTRNEESTGAETPRKAMTRKEALKVLQIRPGGSIANIPPLFLQELKDYLDWSDEDIGILFGVSRINILRKRNTPMKKLVKAPQHEPQAPQAPAPEQVPDGKVSLEEFMNRTDMRPGDELDFLQRHGREMLQTLPTNSQVRVTLLRLLTEQAERRLEAEDNAIRQQFVKMLGFFQNEYIPRAKDEFNIVFKNLKREVAYSILQKLWTEAVPREEILKAYQYHGVQDETAIIDSLERKAFEVADGQGKDFDLDDVFHSVATSFEPIKEMIDEYLEREQGPLRLVGGGTVASPDSVRGGAQYRAEARKEEQERQALGLRG